MSYPRPLSERAAAAIATSPGLWGGHLTSAHRLDAARFALAATVDGHTLADLLDEHETALRVLRMLTTVEWLTTDWHIDVQTGQMQCWSLGDECDPHWVPLADVDPAAAALLTRLEADR